MLDLNYIREHPDEVQHAARAKRVDVDIAELVRLDAQRRQLQQEIDELGKKRNALANAGGGGRPSSETIQAGKAVKEIIQDLEKRHREVDERATAVHLRVPNMPSSDTPVGKDKSENVTIRTWGTPPTFSFTPKEHWELGKTLGIIDTERAAEISGSRFAYLLGDAALLEFALIPYVLSIVTNEETLKEIASTSGLTISSAPFIPVIPPVFIKPDVMEQMARLEPKDDRYHTPLDDLYLIGSAEHTIGPLHRDETLEERTLPRRYIGFSPAFRREAGSYGKDIRGILRLHQFDKLEMESFTTPETSQTEQDFIVAIQERIVQGLGLPYQVVLKCTADQGDPDARAIDIETWFPGQNRYRETHTSDLVTDYQARRLHTKVRRGAHDSEYVHMNDATAIAVGRIIAAILENGQENDGSVIIPEVLRSFMGGRDHIVPTRTASRNDAGGPIA